MGDTRLPFLAQFRAMRPGYRERPDMMETALGRAVSKNSRALEREILSRRALWGRSVPSFQERSA